MLPLLKTAGAGGRVPFGWLPALQSAELMTAFWQQYAGEDSQSSRSGKVKQEVPNGSLLNRQCLLSSRLKVQKIPLSKAIKISKPMHFFLFFYLKTLQQTSRLRILARPPWFICCIQFFYVGQMPAAKSETCMRIFIRFSVSAPSAGEASRRLQAARESSSFDKRRQFFPEINSASDWDLFLSHSWMQPTEKGNWALKNIKTL